MVLESKGLRFPQNPPVLSTLGVQLPLPAPSSKAARDAAPEATSASSEVTVTDHIEIVLVTAL